MADNTVNMDSYYFRSPRFRMNAGTRFFVRLIFYTTYVVLVVADFVFLLLRRDIPWLFWVGIILFIFLFDRLIHFGQAEHSLLNNRLTSKTKDGINLVQYVAPASLGILERAFEKSAVFGVNFYIYLAKFLVEQKNIEEGLLRMDVSPNDFKSKIEEYLETGIKEKTTKKETLGRIFTGRKEVRDDLTKKVEEVVKQAFREAMSRQGRYIEPDDLFSALSSANDPDVVRLFNLFSIDPGDLRNALIFSRYRRMLGRFRRAPAEIGELSRFNKPYKSRHRVMNRAWSAKPTPTLDKYSTDFTDMARKNKAGFLVGHAVEYKRMVDILSRVTKPNALLVGDPGSGKETLISHLAFDVVNDKVPQRLFDKRLVALDITNLISGAAPDEISGRANKIIGEIISAGNIILYIPDIENLANTSGAGYLSVADILLPVITGDAFPVVGSTYPREYKQIIEARSDFREAFEAISVEEISEEEAVTTLTYMSLVLERQYKMMIGFGAIKQSVTLAHKYFRTKLLPSSASDLLKEALADASRSGVKTLTADDVIKVAERKINIPIHKAGKEEAQKLLNLEQIIHEKLIDQEEAVAAVSNSLREYRSGLARQGGPIAVFLFVGPTGVGKTELSKILAGIQFGSEDSMVRFDMSEYQDKTSIFRFIGSPDGTMTGALTDAVMAKPYSLLLLDEFEKAHPDILNLFLSVFDDGRLTDNLGRTVDFQNTIIIATSNAHSDLVKQFLDEGKSVADMSDYLKKKLTDFFRPELLNRFSKIIVFKELSPKDIESITLLNLKSLTKSAEEQGIALDFAPEVVHEISRLGYDPSFGARPLRGVINDKLKSILAEKILGGEIGKGDSILVTLSGSEFQFFKK